jgi:YD repeat-containing protein
LTERFYVQQDANWNVTAIIDKGTVQERYVYDPYDDYQDVRVRKETKEFVELGVAAYPLNTNAEAVKGNRTGRRTTPG